MSLARITRKIAWTSAVIHGVVHASVLLLPALFGDLRRSFSVSFLEIVAVANLMYLAFGMAAIPAGYLSDRAGSRTMLLVSALGCTVSLALASLAPSFLVLSIGLVLLGLSAGIYHPSGLSMLSRGVTSNERGRAIGIHGVGGSVGEAIAPAWAALFAVQFGWRWGFAAAALCSMACAVLTLTLPVVTRERPDGADGKGERHRAHAALSWHALKMSLSTMWKSRPLRWLLLCTIAGGFVYRGVLTFLPLHLGDSAGSPVNASLLTSLVLLAGILAQRFGGELADRLPRERLFLAEMALFAPVLVLLGLTSGLGLIVLAIGFGFLWYMAQPLANALAAAHADVRDHGLLFGLQFAAAFGIGSFATTIGGVLMARGGTSLAFIGFGAVAIVQLGAALALVRSTRTDRELRPDPTAGVIAR